MSRLQSKLLVGNSEQLSIISMETLESEAAEVPLDAFVCSIIQQIQQYTAVYGVHGAVGHIYLPELAALFRYYTSCSGLDKVIARMLLKIKQIISGTRVVVLLSYNPLILSPSNLISNIPDTLLAVESFTGKEALVPAEFRSFGGYLHVRRIQHVNSVASFRSSSNRYGIKRDRRKVHIEPLHLPPEESRAMQTSNAVHGTQNAQLNKSNPRSTSYSSGMSCAPGNSQLLEF